MKRPPRFAVSNLPGADGLVRVGGAELHHMRDVMRLAAGAEVILLDDQGTEYCGRVKRFESKHAVIEVSGACRFERPRSMLSLAAAIIKGPRMDFMVEKAAELGAAELWPLVCARGVARNPGAERIARWRRLAVAAAKQSLTPRTMEIKAPLGLGDLTLALPKNTLYLICTMNAEPLGAVIRRFKPNAVLLACGPEGDFDNTERAAAAAAQFIPVGLGVNRLRSETAAIAALSVAADAMNELSGGS